MHGIYLCTHFYTLCCKYVLRIFNRSTRSDAQWHMATLRSGVRCINTHSDIYKIQKPSYCRVSQTLTKLIFRKFQRVQMSREPWEIAKDAKMPRLLDSVLSLSAKSAPTCICMYVHECHRKPTTPLWTACWQMWEGSTPRHENQHAGVCTW
jgi:hypothetical protein